MIDQPKKSHLFPVSQDTPDKIDKYLKPMAYLQKQIDETEIAINNPDDFDLSANDISALMNKLDHQKAAYDKLIKKIESTDKPLVKEDSTIETAKIEKELPDTIVEESTISETTDKLPNLIENESIFNPIPLEIETVKHVDKKFDIRSLYFIDKDGVKFQFGDKSLSNVKGMANTNLNRLFSDFRVKYFEENFAQINTNSLAGKPSTDFFNKFLQVSQNLESRLNDLSQILAPSQSFYESQMIEIVKQLKKGQEIISQANIGNSLISERTVDVLNTRMDSNYISWCKLLANSLKETIEPSNESSDINEAEGPITVDHILSELSNTNTSISSVLSQLELKRIQKNRPNSYLNIFPLEKFYDDKEKVIKYKPVEGVYINDKTHQSFRNDFKTILAKLLPNVTALSDENTEISITNLVERLNDQYCEENNIVQEGPVVPIVETPLTSHQKILEAHGTKDPRGQSWGGGGSRRGQNRKNQETAWKNFGKKEKQ